MAVPWLMLSVLSITALRWHWGKGEKVMGVIYAVYVVMCVVSFCAEKFA